MHIRSTVVCGAVLFCVACQSSAPVKPSADQEQAQVASFRSALQAFQATLSRAPNGMPIAGPESG